MPLRANARVCVYFGYLPFLHPLFDQVGSPTVAHCAHARQRVAQLFKVSVRKMRSAITALFPFTFFIYAINVYCRCLSIILD